MEEADARVTLVDLSDTTAAGSLTLTLPRRHVEEALSMDEPIDLVLDVSRSAGDAEPETGRIAVAWERNELEQLLGRTDDESITMVFDEDELRRLLDAEFEAHGMREAIAVLAVAVAAGGAASAAMAYPADGTRAGDAAIATSLPARRSRQSGRPRRRRRRRLLRRASRPYGRRSRSLRIRGALASASGIEAVRSAEPLAADTGGLASASGIEAVRSAEPLAADTGALAAASGIEAVRSAEPLAASDTGALAAASGIEAVRSAEPLAADTGALASASGIEAVRSAEPLGASSDTGALASSSAIESVRSAEAASARTPSATDGGFAVSLPSPESTAAVLGGFALLITGAAFVARSKRHELRLP